MKQFVKRLFAALETGYHNFYSYRHEKAALEAKKYLWKEIRLTAEQQKEIRGVYGSKVNSKWYRLYQAYTGRYNKDYFPESLFSQKLEPILCPRNICSVLQDKSLVEILYASVPGIKFPKTIVLNCSGIFYDGNRNIINRDLAINYVEHWNRTADFIIKPTINTGEGRNFKKVAKEDSLRALQVSQLFDDYQTNYIVQECVSSCDEICAIYSNALNTFRVITYISEDKLYHGSLLLRLGGFGSVLDDSLFVGVNEEGYLKEEAFDFEGKKYRVHPDSGITFYNYFIPNVSKVIECAYNCHKKTPHTKFISWDFTLDRNHNPVLIDANLLEHSFWFSQVVCGESTFGDRTKEMLELIGVK